MNPDSFFTELVPQAWNERPAQPVSFDMAVQIDGGSTYHLVVTDGRMEARSDGGATEPLVTLALGNDDFERLAEEIGPSPMALLGGIGGENVIDTRSDSGDRVTVDAAIGEPPVVQQFVPPVG